jgi:3-oxoisoapionate kinase
VTGAILPEGPLVAWYGDDFTGAAAVMEVLEFSGFPSVLFLGPPDLDLLARFAGRRGIGIASDARTRSPEWMTDHLPTAFAALRATGALVVHYKLCSTFDSAPCIGSVGRAAELGIGDWAPMLVAAPRIGRWQAFGNLFARHARGVARLDRHPTMTRHPVTPMDEADLRCHLARQTALPLGLIDLTEMEPATARLALARERAAGARIVALDVVDAATLRAAGDLIWAEAQRDQLFVLGSQGVEDALIAAWVAAGHALPPPRPAKAATGPVAIVSGSCAPETDRQIAAAEAAGFACLRLDLSRAPDLSGVGRLADQVQQEALAALVRGQSVVVFTARGPADPAIAPTREVIAGAGQPGLVGQTLGALLHRLHRDAGVRRLGVAGGDTSGAVMGMLDVAALTAEAEIVPAVPLLHGYAPDDGAAPVELVLKGGQMGPDTLFALLRDGTAG